MSVSPQNSPISSLHRVRSGSSDGEHETRSPASNCSETTDQRPERMRDWLIRYAKENDYACKLHKLASAK